MSSIILARISALIAHLNISSYVVLVYVPDSSLTVLQIDNFGIPRPKKCTHYCVAVVWL